MTQTRLLQLLLIKRVQGLCSKKQVYWVLWDTLLLRVFAIIFTGLRPLFCLLYSVLRSWTESYNAAIVGNGANTENLGSKLTPYEVEMFYAQFPFSKLLQIKCHRHLLMYIYQACQQCSSLLLSSPTEAKRTLQPVPGTNSVMKGTSWTFTW